MSDINDVNVWLGRSNWTADQNTQGEYNEFRVYDRVLTLEDVSRVTTPAWATITASPSSSTSPSTTSPWSRGKPSRLA